MNFTNNYGIQSKSVIDALKSDDYDLIDPPENVVSLTSFIGPLTIETLSRRHSDNIEVDISSRIWTLSGRAVHHIVESSNLESNSRLTERRWFLLVPIAPVMEWELFECPVGELLQNQEWYHNENFYISGKYDCYDLDTEILEDYKFTKAYAVLQGEKEEWDAQMNINAFALRLQDYSIDGLRIVAILKDHDQNRADRDERYPRTPVVEHYCKIWSDNLCRGYILERATKYLALKSLCDSDLPACSPDERWYRGGAYAVMKKGNKKAVRNGVFEETEEGRFAAYKMAEELGPNHYIEPRAGVDVRCTDKRQFCTVQRWCDYYRKHYGDLAPKQGEW